VYVHVLERAHANIRSCETSRQVPTMSSIVAAQAKGKAIFLQLHSDVNNHHIERLRPYIILRPRRDLMEIRTEVSFQRPNQSTPSSILH
jgi:hypothetical protein